MSYNQLIDGYLTCAAVFSFGSIGWLMLRHNAHINPKTVLEAIADPKRRKLPPDAQAKWERDSKIVGRIGTAFVVGWIFVMFFGKAFTK